MMAYDRPLPVTFTSTSVLLSFCEWSFKAIKIPQIPSDKISWDYWNNMPKFVTNFRAGEKRRLRLGFSLICSRIFPNVRLGFHQAMKARRKCFIS